MVTIKNVADISGVSTATVSRVLTRPEIVSAKTRERVLSVVQRLGYSPNPAAATLRTMRTNKIIVTVPNIANSFFAAIIRGAEHAAQKAGYAVLLGDTRNDRDREDQYASMLLRREADGLIFLGHRLPPSLLPLIEQEGGSAPIVNGCEFSPTLPVSSVHIDNGEAARIAMEALYDLGHREIALLTGPLEGPLSRDRLEGAQRAAKARGQQHRLHIIPGHFSLESGKAMAGEFLKRGTGTTAFFCFSDDLAIGALAALRKARIACPDEVSVVGFDDIPMASFVEPALTTIRQPMEMIGRRTVETLLDILAGRQQSVISMTLPHKIVIRGSVAAAPSPKLSGRPHSRFDPAS